jgi:hypothetical protein
MFHNHGLVFNRAALVYNLRMLRSSTMMKALLACTVLLVSLAMVQFVSAAGNLTLYGYVSDTKCAAKGATESHRDCMEQCLEKGAGVVLVTDGDHHIVAIDNPEAVKGHHAHRVALDGYMNGDSFHVTSVRII